MQKIKSIEPLGVMDVWDIEVEDDHSYQAHGFINHNSSRSPNLQNQPREGGYRDCFIADDGFELGIADATAQEPKFVAYISQDDKLASALSGKEKFYTCVARDAMGIEAKKGSEMYNHMKSTILGLFYGMSAKGLSGRIGVSEETAQSYIDAIFAAYPKFGAWYRAKQKTFTPFVQSVTGRKVWLNQYNSGWRRDTLNYPIQSSAADSLKMAANKIATDWKHGNPIKLFVHDEVVAQTPVEDVEEFCKFLDTAMVQIAESLHPGIKAATEVGHGKSWASKA